MSKEDRNPYIDDFFKGIGVPNGDLDARMKVLGSNIDVRMGSREIDRVLEEYKSKGGDSLQLIGLSHGDPEKLSTLTMRELRIIARTIGVSVATLLEDKGE